MRSLFVDDPTARRSARASLSSAPRPLVAFEPLAGDPLSELSRRSRVVGLGRKAAPAIAASTSVLVSGSALGADLWLTLGIALAVVLRLSSIHAPHAGSGLSHAWAVAKATLLLVAVLVLALTLAGAGAVLTDHTIALGLVATAAAAAAAAVAALGRRTPRALLVGDRAGLEALVARWGSGRELDLAGALVVGRDPAYGLGLPVVRDSARLAAFVAEAGVDVVLVAPTAAATPGEVRRIEWLLDGSGVTVLCATANEHVAPHRLGWTVIDGATLTVISVPSAPWSRAMKAMVDRVLGGLLLMAFAPLIAALALVIRLDSPGSPFFTQTRVGRSGRTFKVLKLRTMTRDAETSKPGLMKFNEGNGVLFKMRNDPRVTRVGRWLRASSLDELPQLYNVVRGDMSLVGPRPALPEEVQRYGDLERRRLAVKPGMTGPWQVSGRSTLSREMSMQLDAGYADNWHPAGDARILFRTIDAVLTRRGAF